jgi:hypothetical protein
MRIAALFLLALVLAGCVGYGGRHLVDHVPHREPPEWMYSEDPDDWDVTLLSNGTTMYRLR